MTEDVATRPPRRGAHPARRRLGVVARVVLLLAVPACGAPPPYTVVSGPRDWAAHPAVVEAPPATTLYAVSDVHGGYARLVALLARHGVIDAAAVR